jgi:hypothetical protein
MMALLSQRSDRHCHTQIANVVVDRAEHAI